MKIQEIEQEILKESFQDYDDEDAKINNPQKTRRKRLTLKHINRIRKLREIHKDQILRELEILSFLYAPQKK